MVPTSLDHPFRPTWSRGLLAAALAAIGFSLPQEIPLEYYPLNQPSSGLNYLEITCAASVPGETDFYLNTGHGLNELEKIRFPVSPSRAAYTYTFPLPDAPLFGLRLDPFLRGDGELTITNFRIINRQGNEIHRFTIKDFQASHQIAAIVSTKDGWKLVDMPGADDPYAQIKFSGPIVPVDMNARNLRRCLLSWSYLGLMLWLILLSIYLVLCRKDNRRDLAKTCAFLAVIALLFSLVGNRGLIKNSVRYARSAPAIGSKN